MHSPKALFAIGVLVFIASLAWLYRQDRVVRDDTLVATLSQSMTASKSKLENAETRKNAADNAYSNTPTEVTPQRERSVRRSSAPARRDAPVSVGTNLAAQDPRARIEEQAAQEDPVRGYLSISGRVITTDGTPVPGIVLVAKGQGPSGAQARQIERRARSDEQGRYKIVDLVEGDYHIRSIATKRFINSAGSFRAGTRSADITLETNISAEVFGRVTDLSGTPLAGVEVTPIGMDTTRVRTDNGGNFRTQISGIRPGNIYTVKFNLDGFIEERATVSHEQLVSPDGAGLEVRLKRESDTVRVSGKVRDTGGKSVAGERIQLTSSLLDRRYVGTSLHDGTFTIPNVEPGADYRVTVHPKGPYESYFEQGLTVKKPSTTVVITLQPLETGRISGRMVNPDGQVVGGFNMQLKSNKSQSAFVNVTSNEGGYFTVENAPAGNLVFVTRSQPTIAVSGLTLQPGGSADVELVIDWGNNEISGRVRDDSRRPVPGASVQLSGQYSGRGVHSNSLRRTTTDSKGNFRFSELGSGMHTLTVRMNGFETATKAIDVGSYSSSVEVVLTRSGK